MPTSDHLWDEHEAARYLGVTVYAIRKWRTQGKFSVIKLGSLNRYDPKEIRDFVERQRQLPRCGACGNLIPQAPIKLPCEIDGTEPLYATG